tara:strand:+ start:1861 stop:2691 length:831 start_codon:yes stop_codon:yes gene_type:complete
MNNLVDLSLKKLRDKKIYNPELDLRILLNHSSKINKQIFLNNFNINDINIDYFETLLSKRLNNEPVSKIINKKNFWKYDFYVNSNVLDPRPETEIIIEEVLNIIKDKKKKYKILDLGTGSGCLAICLAKELTNSKITAIDISKKALDVAKKNITMKKLENQIDLKLTNINKIKDKYDIVVCNPPYLTEYEYDNVQPEVKNFEPKIALVGGEDGLKFYRMLSKKIDYIMENNSYFVCEIGKGQLDSCKDIFDNTNLILKNISKDLNKIDRTLTFFKI